MRSCPQLVLALLASTPLLPAQSIPDLLYYRFNETTGPAVANQAVPGMGNPSGTITGTGMTLTPGQYGNALTGVGAASTADYVATGYTANLSGLSWTIEFWYAPSATVSATSYLCGVPVSGAFRIFCGSSAGTNFVASGTQLTTSIITGAVPAGGTWVHVAYVFDASVTPATLTGYANGALAVTTPQTAGVPIFNQAPFIVGGQTGAGLNGRIDEFRLWGSARSASQIASSYSSQINLFNMLSGSTTGGGVGDLSLSLTDLSPGASRGFTLVTAATSAPLATGPLLGIFPDAITWSLLQSPELPGNPLHFPVGIPGLFPDTPFLLPPGGIAVPPGTALDFVSLLLTPAWDYSGHSNVLRIVF